ncbi:Fe-S cluster assembly protein SufD [Flavicella sp.]|nr:Fe-S cluster assembly protein SufD [Flavicella sp.]MDA9111275.1 Fe-S cluster assembly protein SufD [Flavicella sp.]
MELKEKLASSFLAFENKVDIDTTSKVHDIRTEAFGAFESKGFPTKKDEEWKYTSLNAVLKHDYNVFPKAIPSLAYEQVKKFLLNETDCYNLIFIDGVFSSFLSETTHEGLDVCVMSAALEKPKYKMVIDTYFNQLANKNNSLSDLNTAFSNEGAYIQIPKNTVVPKPVQIVNFSTGTEKELLIQPRNLVIVGENAHVQIVERHQSLTENNTLTNSVTEIFVKTRGIVDFYKMQNDRASASLIDSTFVSQKRDSVASVHTFSFGGNLTRNNLEFYQEGEHCVSHLNGISILNEKQHVDNHTLVKHKAPNCESHEMYKGIYDDRATGVFNGKVIVEQAAQKINAFQQNNNIIVGDKASVNTKPQLEIFADDVKCSHGCTIGQLDESALFYMQQRGIPKKEAKALLMYAFSNDALKDVKIPELKAQLNKIIAHKLDVKIGFDL